MRWGYKKRWLASQRALKRSEIEIERLRSRLAQERAASQPAPRTTNAPLGR